MGWIWLILIGAGLLFLGGGNILTQLLNLFGITTA